MATIGVDLGGTKIMAVLVHDADVRKKAKRSTPRVGGPSAVLDAIASTVAKVDPDGTGEAIGVGVPGPVRPGTGVLPYAANLSDWTTDVDVAGELSARLDGRPVLVDNDVNVATLGEHRLGAGRGVDDLLGVYMGTGVGAGLILGGRVRRGPHGLAGEIGHSFVDFGDFALDNDLRGELEDYAGRRAMSQRAQRAHAEGRATALVDLAVDGRMKSSVWEAALAQRDPVAVELVADAAAAMSAALASAVAIVDVEMIVLGGGMAERLGDEFRADLEQRVGERLFTGPGVPVRAATLGSTGGALGAALLIEEMGS